MTKDVVSICIPTYAAEPFITRTIGCALNQTYPAIRVIVSVDACEDRTLDLCRSVARSDSRVHVVEQTERLGWSQNANAALDLVESDFAFVYFHDDLIEPAYVERLVAALAGEPAAASAHCDLEEFGLIETVRAAHDYRGSGLERLADFLMTRRGTTLRSMMRMRMTQPSVRYPLIAGDNRWAAYVFHVALLAAGPALAVPECLYRRWQRAGSLTRSHGWMGTLEDTVASMQAAAPFLLEAVASAMQSPDERSLARYCLRLFLANDLFNEQLRLRDSTPHEVARLVPALADDAARFLPNVLRPETEALLRDFQARVDALADQVAALRSGDDRAV